MKISDNMIPTMYGTQALMTLKLNSTLTAITLIFTSCMGLARNYFPCREKLQTNECFPYQGDRQEFRQACPISSVSSEGKLT